MPTSYKRLLMGSGPFIRDYEDDEERTACNKGDHSIHKGDNAVGLK